MSGYSHLSPYVCVNDRGECVTYSVAEQVDLCRLSLDEGRYFYSRGEMAALCKMRELMPRLSLLELRELVKLAALELEMEIQAPPVRHDYTTEDEHE
ncbi:MAG TPA: hypothetical protein VFQ42_22495 [Mycobacterium sp.]|nr:hypothetical protein [Mycobacterium sp.]